MKNNLKQNVVGDENIITETKNEFVKNICENTTKEKKWKKNCPKCNKIIFYKSRKQMFVSTNKNSLCKSCIRDIVRIIDGKIKCRGCNILKEVKEFYPNRQIKCGRDTFCKECRNKIQRESSKSNPRRIKSQHLRNKYKIGIEEYEIMLNNQNGVCAICHLPETKKLYNNLNKTFSLTVDHCHSTNKIRGLLCQKCNTALGLFRENIEIIKSSIEYIKKNQ